ncbi:MAG: amidohydrolase family protein, partial [Gemmatimonadetes bacterium]|nr:amidohydrolase family protein [Gemmatimonadota bacterium]
FRTTGRQIRNSKVAARQFIEAGAVMAMGTDTGSPLNFHTESAWREIAALVESGMTPIQAISASTLVGARAIRRGDELGTIEPGKLADIMVVRGNPLRDIEVLGQVVHVIKDGVQHK